MPLSTPVDTLSRPLRTWAWVTWGMATVCYLLILSQRIAPAIVAGSLQHTFHLSGAQLGILTAIQFFTYMLMQIPGGVLADMFGPRRILSIGVILAGVGTLFFGLAPSFPMALLARLLVGIGDSLIFLNIMRLQSNWFPPRSYTLLAGLVGLAGAIGNIGGAGPFAGLVAQFGWRTPFLIWGAIILVAGVSAWLIVRDYPADRLPGRKVAPVVPPFRLATLQAGLRQVGGQREIWAVLLAHFGMVGPFILFTSLAGQLYLTQVEHLDHGTAGNLLAITFLSSMIASPLVGWLTARFRLRRWPMLLTLLPQLASYSLFVFAGHLSYPLLIGVMVSMGITAAGGLLPFALAKESNLPRFSGLATGITNSGGFLCGSLLQPAFGAILDQHWQGQFLNGARLYPVAAFQAAFLLCFIATLLGLCGIWFVHETHGRQYTGEVPVKNGLLGATAD